MKTSRTVSLFLIGAALWGCASKAPGEGAALEQLSIVWTLLANTAQGECVAEFAFVNRGQAAVRQGDWALYFNQNTLRMAAPLPDSSKGRVEHVNGDLYRFLPGEEFLAAPGDTLVA